MANFTCRTLIQVSRGSTPVSSGVEVKMYEGITSALGVISPEKPGTCPSRSMLTVLDRIKSNTIAIASSDVGYLAEMDNTISFFDKKTRRFWAASINENGEPEEYVLSSPSAEGENHGEVLLASLFPEFMTENEFSTLFKSLNMEGKDPASWVKLCDNVDLRLNPANTGLASFVNVDYQKGISQATVKKLKTVAKGMTPLVGDFQLITISSDSKKKETSSESDWSYGTPLGDEIVAKYRDLIPSVASWYKCPDFLEDIMVHTKASEHFRNIALFGGAGSGKSEAAKAFAAYTRRPFAISTVHAGMELADLIGSYKPDPEKPGTFKFQEMPAMTAIRYGGVWEIQEVNAITRPGELVALNSLLDEEGTITLPTGEIVKRNPDCVIFMTSNIGYEGTKQMNQALFDRSDIVINVETPSIPEMVTRVASRVGWTGDESVLTEMAQIIKDISSMMNDQGMQEGTCGMRSLISWASSTMITNDAYSSFMLTVLPKCTPYKEDQDFLKKRITESSFAPKKRIKRI